MCLQLDYTSYQSTHGTFIKIGHIIDHKTNFKKIFKNGVRSWSQIAMKTVVNQNQKGKLKRNCNIFGIL